MALLSLEKNLNKVSVMKNHNVWDVLGMTWAPSMAYAMTFLDKLSDLRNIIHNYQCKKNGGNKPIRAKTVTKVNMPLIVESYIINLKFFMTMKNGNADMVAKNRERFAMWDKETGVRKDKDVTDAGKRPSIQPDDEPNKKQKTQQDEEGEYDGGLSFYKELIEAQDAETAAKHYNAMWTAEV